RRRAFRTVGEFDERSLRFRLAGIVDLGAIEHRGASPQGKRYRCGNRRGHSAVHLFTPPRIAKLRSLHAGFGSALPELSNSVGSGLMGFLRTRVHEDLDAFTARSISNVYRLSAATL